MAQSADEFLGGAPAPAPAAVAAPAAPAAPGSAEAFLNQGAPAAGGEDLSDTWSNAALRTAGLLARGALSAGAQTAGWLGHAVTENVKHFGETATEKRERLQQGQPPPEHPWSLPSPAPYQPPDWYQPEALPNALGLTQPATPTERVITAAGGGAAMGGTPGALSGAASQTAAEAGLGPGAQLAAGLVAGAGPSAAASLVRGGARGAARTAAAAQEATTAGVPITVGQATGSPLVQRVEQVLATVPGGAGVLDRVRASQARGVGATVGSITDGLSQGVEPTPAAAGGAVQQGVETTKNGMSATEDAAYKNVDQHVPQDHPMQPTLTSNVFERLAAPVPGAARLTGEATLPAAISDLRDRFNATLQENNGTIPYAGLRAMRSDIGSRISPLAADQTANGQYKMLYGALSEDLKREVSQVSPDAALAMQGADSVYKRNVAMREVLDRVVRQNGGPEAVFNAALRGTGPSGGATNLNTVLDALTPEQHQLFAAAYLHRMNINSPAQFLTAWTKMNPATKTAIFDRLSGGYRQNLDALANTIERVQTTGKWNPPETARGVMHATLLSELLGVVPTAAFGGHVGHMVAAGTLGATAGTFGAAKIAAHVLTSPSVVRWLSRETRPFGPSAADTAAARAQAASQPFQAPPLSAYRPKERGSVSGAKVQPNIIERVRSALAERAAPPKTVRLYRGENFQSLPQGDWWTQDPRRAASYGRVSYMDVTHDELGQHFTPHTRGNFEFTGTDHNILNRARPAAELAAPRGESPLGATIGGGKQRGAIGKLNKEPESEPARLNVGLHQGDPAQGGRVMDPSEVRYSIANQLGGGARPGLTAHSTVLHPGPDHPNLSEPTLVVDLPRHLTPIEGDRLAANLKQQAIPQKNIRTGEGTMLGAGARTPAAAAQGWDKFNPDYFHEHDGRTATQHAASFNPEELEHPQTVNNAVNRHYPGIYHDPRDIVSRVQTAPEDPIMRQLFGKTRKDLHDDATGRGDVAPDKIPGVNEGGRARGSAAAKNVTTDANADRIRNTITAFKNAHPDAYHGMVGWYEMQALHDKILSTVKNPKLASATFDKLNTLMGMASPGSNVVTEINRGTAANMLATRGEFAKFEKYGGNPGARASMKNAPELANVSGHPYHSTSQAGPMRRYLDTGTGAQAPKTSMYIRASDAPNRVGSQYQNKVLVGDSHFSRGIGLSDVRTSADPHGSISGPELADIHPWYHENVAKPLGLSSTSAQAVQWGALAKETGVGTAVGAPKLELFSQEVAKAATRAGVTPEVMLERIIKGAAHAG